MLEVPAHDSFVIGTALGLRFALGLESIGVSHLA
jgi:hypothetical protein